MIPPFSIAPQPAALPERSDATAIHAFRIPLNSPPDAVAALRALLSDDERARADRFRDPLHGRRFTAGRAALRMLLAPYLRTSPESIAFQYGVKGKPSLAHTSIAFNLSHSADLAVLAIANRGAIGIDVERFRDDLEDRKLAARFFSDAELADLNSLTGDAWQQAFYACWTRKEAYMKGVGDGFAIPLRSFRVSVLPDAPPALLEVPADPGECRRWALRELSVPAGFRACIAAQDPIGAVDTFDVRW